MRWSLCYLVFSSLLNSLSLSEIPANLDQLVVGIKDNDNFTSILLNFGQKYRHFENIEEMLRNKIDILSKLLKIHIDRLRSHDEQVELVFLVDSSGSVGLENFQSELNFVRKLLADFTVKPTATRVALITFAGKKDITRNIDQISSPGKNDQKCYLLNKQLNKITYSGGGTYTKGALLEALAILENSRKAAKKVVFLITDGYSNGGDPRPVAHLLKSLGTTIFTFGIRTGNVEELHDIASVPGYTHSYLLDSFSEFEALARRALHRDLIAGEYVAVATPSDCNILCSEKSASSNNETCCDALATCTCGTATGHYACLCPAGYFGSGFKGLCQLCPNGTYGSGDINGDSISTCISCPDVNHITLKIPATSVEDCICASGFTTDGRKCEVITCPKLRVPENGYLVKASACSNVVNAACGVRCKIGFHLTGDSIRLCRKNGSWSGNEPQCLLKTCPALRAPIHGKMRCQHDIDYNHPSVDSTSHPIDTRCQFRCEIGFQLRGSKVRNCLPLSRWDGLKVTCRALKCEPLRQVSNGEILPKNCLGPEKLPFATNCSVICKDGFTLEGPRARFCGGRTGIWSQRHSVNRCVDKIPPVIKCPSSITMENLKGENFAYVNWTVPIAIDNTDDAPTVWSKPHIVFPWKVKIGSRTIIYIAQDSSGNKARCKFKVAVIDKESPVAQDCIDPPIFFTDIQTGVENVIWDEPVFHDNSKIPVKMTQSHIPLKNNFPIGKTKIIYNATDTYGNFAICTLNITVEDICTNFPSPINGQIKCEKNNEEKEKCILTCNEGYGFPIEIPYFEAMDNELLLRCNARNRSWTDFYFPECSEATLPKSISQDGNIFLESNETVYCNNSTNLQELSDNINEDLRLKLIEICRNDIDCNLVSFDPICEEEMDSQHVNNNLIRKRRQFKDKSMKKKVKKDKIEIKFKFIGKIIEENMDNPKVGLQKLREKIESLTRSGKLNLLNNKTNQEIAKLALNLHLVFEDPQKLCEDGSVLKKNSCVKCSRGTFYNNSTGQCQSCPFGQYQNVTGSSKCERCPYNTFTKRMHAKSIEECIRMCQPGFYSRRRRYQNQFFSLEPCSICEIGSYQPNYGEHLCLPCPSNTTTKYHGSTSIYNCMPLTDKESICDKNPCSNGGSCIKEEDTFSCDCPNNYIGSRCEIIQSPCHSFPCLNAGVCNMKYEFQRSISYSCTCKSGYTGKNCEKYLDECSTNPCQNGGECKSTENDYVCECKEGYEGPFCEIFSDHCLRAPCIEGSTCQTINETWHCICKPGFLGRHCNLLPCDWLPCHEKAICINLEELNATRNSYRCECPPGFIGFDCATKIDFCKSEPCKNNGKCVNRIGNYTCECSVPFKGINCETELSSNYVMHFQKSGIADYVMIKGPIDDLSEISTCFWLQSVDTLNYGTILSYATEYSDNTFTITDYNGFVLYVNGDKIVTDIKANDGYWHFLCITWESSNGSWSIFVDGLLRDNGTLLSKGKNIRANGSLVIGQEQDRVGGGFSESESFLGKMSLFDIWSTIVHENNITHFLNTCETYYGNLFAWPQMQEFIHGEIMILKSPFCRGCLLPVVPFKGNLNFSENLIEVTYTCEDGYVVKYGKEEYKYLKRKCLKYGQWEGREGYTPYCEKIKCGYPGYFPRGRIHGISYNFGDEIQYSCFKGHELRGNPRRICNASGKWSGSTPICIGITCKNLLAPENGDIEYIIEEYERDDISILQVGHQLEFKCDPGFRLKGEKLLTCMENGVWDHERPECISSGCPPPKEIEHGYIASVTSEAINHTTIAFEFKIDPREDKKKKIYFYGDIIGFSCHQGYKFRANHNLLAEFRLQCSNDGTWTGFVPDCVLLYCPWPNPVENGTIFLRLEDNTTIEIPLDDNMTMYEWNIKETENSAEKETTKFLKELFVPGAYISTICHQGFQLIGEKSRICTENEIWSEESPICQIRECPEHPLLKVLSFILEGNQKNKGKHLTGSSGNLTFSSQGNVYGNLIIFNCLHNMKINLNPFVTDLLSNLTWQCDANGIWHILHLELNSTIVEQLLSDSKRETCRNLICPPPKIPEFGFIMPINSNNFKDETSSSDIVTFNCRQGYFLEGNEKSICLLNGTWSSFPTCKPIVCGTPITYPNAEIIGKVIAKDYTFGNVIFYQCIPGYRLFGQAYVRCLSNGKWSKLHSRCAKISCGKPKTIPGVILRGQSYLYQDQLTYTCPNKKEQGSITCKSDGHWTNLTSCNNN